MTALPDYDELVANLNDPAPDWRWFADITIPNIGQGASTYDPSASSGVFTYNPLKKRETIFEGLNSKDKLGKNFRYRIEEIPGKYWGLDTDQRYYAGSRWTYPTFRTIEPINLTLYEDDKYGSFNTIKEWMNLIVDKDGNYSPLRAYARDIVLYAFDGVSNTIPRLTITYKDCYPTHTGEQPYAYGNNGRVRWSVPFVVNSIE